VPVVTDISSPQPAFVGDKKLRIFIMSPKGGNPALERRYTQCVDELLNADLPQFEFIRAAASGCGVAKARNILAAYALNMNADAILAWDRDVSPEGETPEERVAAIVRLLSWPSTHGNMAALYSIKSEDAARWVMTPLPGEKRQPDGLLRVAESGTGMKVMWTWQMRQVIKAFPEIAYQSDDVNYGSTMYDLFSMGVVPCGQFRRWLSEDYYYDFRLKLLCYPIWVDTGVTLLHRGETPDGRIIDFPPYPLPLPGGDDQQYSGDQGRLTGSLDVDHSGIRSIAYTS